MKKILITRHAKTVNISKYGTDFSRPLSDIGISDCELIGNQLQNNNFVPDFSIISSSIRTVQTYENISKYLESNSNNVEIKDSIYGIGVNGLINKIKMINDEINTLMVVGHNPTMHLFSSICLGNKIEKFSPGSAALFSFDINSWGLFDARCNLEFFIKPEDFK